MLVHLEVCSWIDRHPGTGKPSDALVHLVRPETTEPKERAL